MAPSPAAGKPSNGPKTPTKLGRKPGGTPQKLGQSSTGSKNAPSTPKAASSQKPSADSAKSAADNAKGKADDAAQGAKETADDAQSQAQSQAGDDDEPVSKVSQAGQQSQEGLEEAAPEPIDDDDDDATGGATQQAQDTAEDAGDEADDTADDATEKAGQTVESADDATDDQEQQQQEGGGLLKDTAGKAKEGAEEAAEGAQESAEDGVDEAQKVAGETTDDATDGAQDAADDAQEGAQDAAEGAQDQAEDAQTTAEEGAEQAKDGAEDAAENAQDGAEDAAEGAQDQAEGTTRSLPQAPEGLPLDLSGLKGLEVQEDGNVLDSEGNPVAKLAEGDAEDLAGYPIGDDGEILDDDGDLVGRVELLPDQIKKQLAEAREQGEELPEGADEYLDQLEQYEQGEDEEEDEDEGPALPGLEIMNGLSCQIDGIVYDSEGNTIGRVTDGDPSELQNATLNEQGEFIDEDGNVVGHAEIHDDAADLVQQGIYDAATAPDVDEDEAAEDAEEAVDGVAEDAEDTAEDAAEDAAEGAEGEAAEIEDQLPGIEALEGRELNDEGQIVDEEGDLLGAITDDELKQKIIDGEVDPSTLKINEAGEVLDADGNVVGQTELAEGAAEKLAGGPLLDQRILEGKKLNKKGKVLDEDGEEIGELREGDLSQCAGKKVNDKGEILDKDGNLLGRVSVVQGEAAENATRELLEELGELEPQEDGFPDLSTLDGLKVNKKGKILNEDGDEIGELVDGELSECAGKKVNDKGEVLDKEGKVIGRVTTLKQGEEEEQEQEEEAAEEEPTADFSFLDGRIVNKKGKVLNEDGEEIAELTDGEVADCAGKKINNKGEVVDSDGNVIGHVQPLGAEEEDNTPDLADLEGYKVNKSGLIVNEDGEQIGELVDGELEDCAGKKVNKKGEVLDSEGNVIGHVQPSVAEPEQEEVSPEIAALEGLKVNKSGLILNEDGEQIGQLVDGELEDCAGKKVNGNGEVLDDEGNVIGHVSAGAEEEEEEDDGLPPLSILEGLTVNKSGKLIDDNGAVVGELIEGDAKKLSKSGNTCDAEGQFWDSKGHVIGRAQTLPQEDAEEEAIFAGLEGLKVVEDGWVEDENGNRVGTVVEGDAKKLIGRVVDEDGDILDKKGSAVGRAERYEEPEEEPQEEVDLSFLAGKTLNKAGYIIGDEGVPVAQLVEGKAKDLAGKQVDEYGQIWNDKGAVIGRVELIPEEDREPKPEGPFAGLEGLKVIEDGQVADENGNVVGEIVEGNPKKLIGLAVDEDGDIVDRYGNVKGHADPLPEEEEQEVDNSILAGKELNKQGYVVDEQGTPFGRLVEGDAKELAGRRCDENGFLYNDTGKAVGRCEVIPEDQRVARPEGPFAGLEGLRVVKDGWVEDEDSNRVGQLVEGNAKRLVGLAVDEDGDIIDKYGNVKGHAEPYEEEDEEAVDMSALAGCNINKNGNAVDFSGQIIGRVVEGDVKSMIGKKVDGEGQIWDNAGNVVGRCELVFGEDTSPEGPFAGFDNLQINKDETVTTPGGDIIGRIIEGDIQKLLGHTVDEDGDIVDKNGNTIGKAERWQPEEKERKINPMSGMRVNKEGEVRDENGDLVGRLTDGDLGHCVGQEIDDSGNVVDVDGNKIGEVTLLENIADDYEGPTEEELEEARKREEERQIAEKMNGICTQTLERMQPICKQITEHIEKADRTPKEELDEEELVNQVKPLIEEGGRILQECNGSLRGLDPDGKIAAQAKGRAGTGEATPEEHKLAENLKELTTTVVQTIDNAKKKLNDMPHAKKKLNPLWGLMTQPLFQILAAVGLLLAGVLGLVGQLLNGLGLGGLVNGLMGGLGINKLLESFGLIDPKKKGGDKKKGGGGVSSLPIVGGLLGGNK